METRKPLSFVGPARGELVAFPDDARQDAGYQLDRVQAGRLPDRFDHLPGLGSGVMEIKVDDDGEAFRVVYVARFPEAVYVLHAFHKKSRKGKAFPKQNRETATARYRALLAARKQAGLT